MESENSVPQTESACTDAVAADSADLASRLGRIEKLLERVVDHLYQAQREEQIREFSLLHLAGALCLVLSIVFIIGAVLALLQKNLSVGLAWATIGFLGAISMQGLSLVLTAMSRRK